MWRRPLAWRARAWEEMQGQRGALPVNFEALAVAESPQHPDLIGRKVTDIATERGVTPLDVMLDVSIEENLETRFTSVLANNDPEAIAWLLPQDTVLLGLADVGHGADCGPRPFRRRMGHVLLQRESQAVGDEPVKDHDEQTDYEGELHHGGAVFGLLEPFPQPHAS